jgi:hypothetical protein
MRLSRPRRRLGKGGEGGRRSWRGSGLDGVAHMFESLASCRSSPPDLLAVKELVIAWVCCMQ